MATKTQLIGGGFQDALGNVLANGYLTLRLSQDCTVSGSGTICSGIDITIQLDSNGNVASSTSTPSATNQYVWSNLVMSPQNNYYRVTGFTAEGQRAFGPNNQQVASGSTFNLDSWTPNTVISWFPPLQPPPQILLEVNNTPTASQVIANFVASSGITITDEGGGVIQFAASGTPTTFEVNGTDLTSSSVVNFVSGTGITVSNPSAGEVLITNTLSGGGALGKWPGNWAGCMASGANGFSLTSGANVGTQMGGYQSNSTGSQHATATGGARISDVASTSLGETGGLIDTNFNISLGVLQDWLGKLTVRSIASPTRYWIGVSDQSATGAETVFFSDTPAANFVGFRFSTTASDTHYQAVCQTGSGTQTLVDTGVVPSTSTPQILEFVPTSSGTSVNFYINGVSVATISTTVPATSTAMASLIAVGDSAGNSSFDFYYLWFLLNN